MLERVQFVTASSPRDLSDSENLPYCWVEPFSARGRVKRFSNDNNPHYIPLLNITKKKNKKRSIQFFHSSYHILLCKQFHSTTNLQLWKTFALRLVLNFLFTPFSSNIPANFDGPNVKYLLGRMLSAKISCAILSLD